MFSPEAKELKKHFKGKVIIGSSAGANMLSKYFWSSKRGVFGEGQAILSANVMVHYGTLNHEGHKRTSEDWRREEAEFQKRIEGQVITHLPEGQFLTVEQ